MATEPQGGKVGGISVAEEAARTGQKRISSIASDGTQELKRWGERRRHQARSGRAVQKSDEASAIVDTALEDIDGFASKLRGADEDEHFGCLENAAIRIRAMAADECEAGCSLYG